MPFQPILLALNTPTCKLAKFLVPILKPLTSNEFTLKDSFHFAEETVNHQPDFFMGSLDVDFLFTSITLEETIETNEQINIAQMNFLKNLNLLKA